MVTGKVCDVWLRNDTGTIFTKTSGTGNTGWSGGSGVTGSGTTGFIPKWTGTTSLGDTELLISGKSVLPNLTYDINLGSLQKKYLTLHAAELWVETLVAQNTLATIGGRVLVGPTNALCSDFGTGATTLTFKYNNFANGDRIYFESNGVVEFMAVISGASAAGCGYNYNVTRNLDGSGANDWFAGDAAINTGTTGSGFIDIYSVRGIKAGTEVGPTMVGNVRNSTTYNDWSPRWAIGNCDGLYGYSGTVYCAAFGVPTAAWVKIDPTNGIRIGHNVTTKISLDASGNASFTGNVTASSGDITGALVAGSITTTHIAVNTILAADIAAGTITATEIAANTITADRLNVSSLSAISANIGTITAGSISGVTATFGTSSSVTLDTNGLTFSAGTNGYNRAKWSDGSYVNSNADVLAMVSEGSIDLTTSGGALTWDASKFYAVNSGKDLGSSGSPWRDLYLSSLAGLGANRTVCSDNSGKLYTVASGVAC